MSATLSMSPVAITYRVAEAAALLGVSRRTVDRMLEGGVLEAVRPLGAGRGRLVLVTGASIQRFLSAPARTRITERPGEEQSTEIAEAFVQFEDAVARVVALAPPLTSAQRERLAVLLAGGAR